VGAEGRGERAQLPGSWLRPKQSAEVRVRGVTASYFESALAPRKTAVKSEPIGDWAAPTVARFPDQESRDGFLRSVTANVDDAWEAKPNADDGRMAWVRWRHGHFLSLNDLAYARHGRINVTVVRGTGVSAPGVHVARRHGRIKHH
jgi:hypothetical protein